MSDISVSKAHGLTLDEAKAKTSQIVTDVKAEFPALINKIDWNSDNTKATVKGKAFTGDFTVDSTNMNIDIKLKMLAKPFKSKVEEKIKERMEKYFG